MPPLIPRRRSRRRPWSGRAVILVCGLVVTVILLGGVTQVSRQSGAFTLRIDRSFARQGTVVSDASNITAANVRHLLAVMRTEGRRTLQDQLDSAVQQAATEQSEADSLVSNSVPDGLGQKFTAVFADRARAITGLRSALDGLLGMHPLVVVGAPASQATEVANPTLVSASEAVSRISAAGALLSTSDQLYRQVRHSLAQAKAHAALPKSIWVEDDELWNVSSVTTAVDLVATSSSLAATHQLELRTVQLSPSPLPSPSGAVTPGVSVLSPTKTISVSVVLSNLGSVDESRATVQFTLIPDPGGAAKIKNQRIGVAAGSSVTMDTVTFPVQSGHDYQLSVAVVLPVDQTDDTNTSVTDTLEIAPGT